MEILVNNMIKIKSKFLFIVALFLIIFTAQAVMAEDVDQAALSEIDDSSLNSVDDVSNDMEESSDDYSEEILSDGEGTFTELQELIDNSDGTLNLSKNYKYDSSVDSAKKDGITITKAITINGNGYSIDGDNQARMFTIEQEFSKYKIFRNITFMNGYSSGDGGAISGWYSYYIYLYDCTFINNHASDGGAVYMWHGGIINCTFEDNVASGAGGAVKTYYYAVSVIDSTFNRNDATNGGAVDNEGNMMITNSKFNNNAAKFTGGAVKCEGYKLTVEGCEFNSNSAYQSTQHGGAIYLDGSAGKDSSISSSIFYNNTAREGGAVYVKQPSVSIKDTKFNNNHAEYVKGGAIFWASDNGAIEACEFNGNIADECGGAVYISSSNNVSISKSSFSENIANHYQAGAGADINSENSKNITIISSNFINNKENTYEHEDIYENIYLNQVEGANISDCKINGILTGIKVDDSQDITLEGNTIETTADVAIDASGSNVNIKNNQLKAGDKVGDNAITSNGGEVNTEGNIKVLADSNLQAIAESKFEAETLTFTVTITATTQATGKVTVKLLDAAGNILATEEVDIIEGQAVFTKTGLDEGAYNYTVEFAQDADFNAATVDGTLNVVDGRFVPSLDVSSEAKLDADSLEMVVTVTVATDASGKVTVKFFDENGNELETKDVDIVGGSAVFTKSGLADGVYKYSVVYAENVDYKAASANGTVTVKDARKAADLNVDAQVSFDMKDLVNSVIITVKTDATGNVTVTLYLENGTVIAENVTIENGTAIFKESFLSAGKYSYKVEFFDDANNKENSTTGNLTINKHTTTFTPKTANVDYGFTYDVLVKIDGKAVGAGKEIVLKIAGKTLKAKTNKNGYTTFKLALTPKKYSATLYMNNVKDEFKGTKKVAVTVKNVIKAKNAKVKKSAKKLKIKATLKTSAKKPIAGKKIVLKINGKKVKATTNKKGVATFKVKKSILKKLKAGKKYKFQVVYGSDIVKKTLKVKK